MAFLALASTLSAEVNRNNCAACHGKNFEKKALGKSDIVKDLTHAEIAKRLKGYKDGTRNSKGMGSIMRGQIGRYSVEDIEAFALTIGK